MLHHVWEDVICCDQNRIVLQWNDALKSGFIQQLLDGCTEPPEEGVHLVDCSCTSDIVGRVKRFLEGDSQDLDRWLEKEATEQSKLKFLECANFLDIRELLAYFARTPQSLHIPCTHGRPDLIRALIEHNADPTVKNKRHQFLYLEEAKDEACAHEINRAIRLSQGWTELMLAASEGSKEQAEYYLLKHENRAVVVNILNNDRRAALHYAAENGNAAVVNFLIEARAKVDAGDSAGKTALHLAASEGRVEALIALLDAGANVNVETSCSKSLFLVQKHTPLFLAAKSGHVGAAQILLERKALIDKLDQVGCSFLMWFIEI